ncbi:MAG: FkbM family methyltransferase [Bacteroidota bacterium]
MLTRLIYPLSLREKVSYRLQKLFPNVNDRNISVEFNKQLKFDLSKTDVGHQSIIFNGYYELELSKTMVRLGKEEGGVMVDVGANYGYFSCLWAAQKAGNRVYAFEASPLNLEPLRNNIRKNELQTQVEVLPIAIGKEKGILKFDLATDKQQTGWGGFTIGDTKNSVEVAVERLDDYTTEHGIEKISVLKIDTEGADTWVLYGAKQLLQEKRIKHIFFEHNPTRMKLLNIRLNEAEAFLKGLGYRVEQRSAVDFYAYPKG